MSRTLHAPGAAVVLVDLGLTMSAVPTSAAPPPRHFAGTTGNVAEPRLVVDVGQPAFGEEKS